MAEYEHALNSMAILLTDMFNDPTVHDIKTARVAFKAMKTNPHLNVAKYRKQISMECSMLNRFVDKVGTIQKLILSEDEETREAGWDKHKQYCRHVHSALENGSTIGANGELP